MSKFAEYNNVKHHILCLTTRYSKKVERKTQDIVFLLLTFDFVCTILDGHSKKAAPDFRQVIGGSFKI